MSTASANVSAVRDGPPASVLSVRLEAHLQRTGLVADEVLDAAVRLAADAGIDLASALVRLGVLAGEQVQRALEECTALASLDPRRIEYDSASLRAFVRLFDGSELRARTAFPVRISENHVHLIVEDPTQEGLHEWTGGRTGCRVKIYVGYRDAILSAVDEHFPASEEGAAGAPLDELIDCVRLELGGDTDRLAYGTALTERAAMSAHALRLVQAVLGQAAEPGVSDLHIETAPGHCAVRVRRDGVLRGVLTLPEWVKYLLSARIRQMARLVRGSGPRVDEGRIDYPVMGRADLDLRVTIVPSLHGEDFAVRLLDRQAARRDLAALGLPADFSSRLEQLLGAASGLLLIAGPTGSGKTTTLYACLRHVNRPDRKVVTVEDPVEYQLDGVTQVTVQPEAGLTFGACLRTFLRMDADVVVVGELRDRESMITAMRAALTGHLVIGTVHTTDAAATVARLLDLGLDPIMIATSLVGVIAQRLLRVLCDACAREVDPQDDPTLRRMYPNGPPAGAQFRDAGGCERCFHTGYSGRVAVAELLVADDAIQRLVLEMADPSRIRAAAGEAGMLDLQARARDLIERGLTSAVELVRVMGEPS